MGRKHVILLTVDCLRADRLGCYGYHRGTSPNIDRLAKGGIRYARCYSTGPRTNESFPGIVASALSTDCGYVGDSWHRTPPTPTIASWLSSNGYDTAARLANPQLAAAKRYDTGFDSFANLAVGDAGWGDISEPEDETTGTAEESNLQGLFSRIGSEVHDIRQNLRSAGPVSKSLLYTPLFCGYREYQRYKSWPIVDSKVVADELLQTLPDASVDQPIFRWSHFNDIHAPIHPDRVNQSALGGIPILQQYLGDIERLRQDPSNTYERMYDAMVRYVDDRVGDVIEGLKQRGIWGQSIVIVTGDHGEALYDRGVYGHASGQDQYLYDTSRDYLYNELLHVPLICGGGAVEQSKTVHAPFSTAWLNELIAEVGGVPEGEFVRSSGLDSVLSESDSRIVLADALTDRGHTFSAISNQYKLTTRSLKPEDDILADAHFFDLSKDPGEKSPIHTSNVPSELVDAIDGNVRTLDNLSAVSSNVEVTGEVQDRLSQLGYVG